LGADLDLYQGKNLFSTQFFPIDNGFVFEDSFISFSLFYFTADFPFGQAGHAGQSVRCDSGVIFQDFQNVTKHYFLLFMVGLL
jgi:hypothetical protein